MSAYFDTEPPHFKERELARLAIDGLEGTYPTATPTRGR